MINNKISRRRAEKLAKKQVIPVGDGTEVLASQESRAKLRRWTYDAELGLVIEPKDEEGNPRKDADGNVMPPVQLPPRRIKLDSCLFGTAQEAKAELSNQLASLRNISESFKKASIRVFCVPHETVSHETLRQLNGYRDMAMLLDHALGMAVEEAESVVSGRSVGSVFVQSPASDVDGTNPAKPARTLGVIKEHFYKLAVDRVKSSVQLAPQDGVATPDPLVIGTEKQVSVLVSE